MSKKIYISGKISGIEDSAPALFEFAEKQVIAMGNVPVNPMKINHDHHDKSWSSYMKEDIKALCECEAIYMLKNWQESKGAKIEYQLAESIGLEVMFQ